MGMDQIPLADNDFVDLESGCGGLNNNRLTVENVKMLTDKEEGDEAGDFVEEKLGKDRRKTSSGKKPPRPPKSFSLDAADQKLIREISELIRAKRVKIERMKALKKMKAAKPSKSAGNLFATIFTIVFFLVIICQGISPERRPALSIHGSPESAQVADYSSISAYYEGKTPAIRNSISNADSVSPSLVEQVSGKDPLDSTKRAVE